MPCLSVASICDTILIKLSFFLLTASHLGEFQLDTVWNYCCVLWAGVFTFYKQHLSKTFKNSLFTNLAKLEPFWKAIVKGH